MLGASSALGILAIADSLTLTIVFSILYGLSWGLRGPLMNAMRGDYFGRASFGKIAGFSSLLTLPPALFGPIFAGVMADLNGDYIIGFLLLSILSGIGSVIFLAAKPPNLPLRFQFEQQLEDSNSH
jgi:MFS family permease